MKLSVKGQLQRAVYAAFAAGFAVAMGAPTAALAQEAAGGDESVDLDKVEVTGSRLKRSDVEGALPVTVIDRQQIEMSGQTSVADLLRNMGYNSFGSFRQQSGSSAQSVALIDLRGLGSERTLVLIDGRRAPKAPTVGSAQDLNVIPLAAVERVEILKDGASAIYGSDAIGGVVNVILRKDFEGVEVSYGIGRPTEEGGDTEHGSVIYGINGDKGNIVMGASYNKRDIIYTKDRPWGSTPGYSLYGNNYVSGATGFVRTPVPGGCQASNAFYIAPNGLCSYNFNLVAADEASTDLASLFAKGRYQISDNWSTYTTASVSRSKSFGRYAPSPAVLFVPGSNSNIDADGDGTNDDIYVYHRFDALGNRDDNVEGNVYDLSGGFQGKVGMFDIDVGARYNESQTFTLGRNYVVLPIASQYATDGLYNFIDPLANDPATLNAMKATINRDSNWTTRELWGSVSFDMFALPGGMSSIAVGAEYRSEDYYDKYDSLSEGGVIGGSAGNSAALDRSVRAAFTEMAFPILSNLELGFALRYDDYSDFGDNVAPKVSLRYQPVDILTLRASYGQGFRAPTLDVLSQQPAFSAESIVNDPATCTTSGYNFTNGVCVAPSGQPQEIQVDTTILSNAELDAEKSDQYTLGMAVEPTKWFNFSLDYYNVKVTDSIRSRSVADVIDCDLDPTCVQGSTPLGSFGVERNSAGAITLVTTGTINEGELETNGLDLATELKFDLGNYGRIVNRLRGVYILSFKIDGDEQLKDPGYPELRANMSTTYSISDFEFAWNLSYVDSTASVINGFTQQQSGHVPSWTTHDFQANYNAPWNGTVTVGVNNAFNRMPDNIPYDGRPYNFYLFDAYGRTPYINYTQRF